MKLVIIGGGFGGLQLAKDLNNQKGIDITLIDQYNYHQFQPLFYQVATASLDPSNISFPLRKVFQRSKNIRIRMATVQQVESAQHKVITDIGDFEYDILVLATGTDTNFFGNKKLTDHAFPMKSTLEALQLRHRLLQNFEDALRVTNEKELDRLLTIIIVGGGPTGVELAGAIAEMRKYILPKDYPELDFGRMKIYLLEGSGKTLGAMSDKSVTQSQQYLKNLGVVVTLNTVVKDYDGSTVTLSSGETLQAATVIWAAGVKGNIPGGIKPELVARGNRIKVDRTNRILGVENIYAIGDVSYMETPKYPNSHPQVAPVAMQQARLLASNLKKIARQSLEPLKEFEYFDKGAMATIGRNLAVVDIPKPKLHFGGFFAWLIWMFLHLLLILGVKNKVFIFINWLVNYFTHDQSLRLIFKGYNKQTNAVEVMKPKVEVAEKN